jgi:pimeloyl-ACP methyl ester carboxylesterase
MSDRWPVVFVHGAGRAGRANWPEQQSAFPSATYLTLSGFGDDEPAKPDIQAWADQIRDACGDGAHIVAHSYGAIPVAQAAANAPSAVRSMILMEPALYSLARGAEHVEDHIARMSPVLAAASNLTAAEYQLAWLTAIGTPDPVAPSTRDGLRAAERLRLLPAPWDLPTPATAIAEVSTLVVTGRWNEEFEEIASALVRFGATHRSLTGFGHRVPDHPDANALIRDWTERR